MKPFAAASRMRFAWQAVHEPTEACSRPQQLVFGRTGRPIRGQDWARGRRASKKGAGIGEKWAQDHGLERGGGPGHGLCLVTPLACSHPGHLPRCLACSCPMLICRFRRSRARPVQHRTTSHDGSTSKEIIARRTAASRRRSQSCRSWAAAHPRARHPRLDAAGDCLPPAWNHWLADAGRRWRPPMARAEEVV